MNKMFHTRISTILTMVLGVLLLSSCQKEFTITVQSNNEAWGSVTGNGTYTKGTVISIGAIANSNYKFQSWQDGNTDNPRSITVEENATYTAIFVEEGNGGEEPTGLAVFSVSATQKVMFSPGNLQWSATGSHAIIGGGIAAGTWRFASNQWDTIGAGNNNISSTYTGWIDLFGWGTSGYNNKYPYMTKTTYADYGNGDNDIADTYYDWGVYNAIYNSKTNTTEAPGTWRTLTKDEWGFLLNDRTPLSGIRYAHAEVNGVNGIIIVPDNWEHSIYSLNNVNSNDASYTSNIINATDWSKLEAVGCVFLPAAGSRGGTSVNSVDFTGRYWSASYYNSDGSHHIFIGPNAVSTTNSTGRSEGLSVRLVKNVH